MKKKILIYNWTQFDGNEGGGVTVYCNNIINLLKDEDDIELYFLSSGSKYTFFGKKIKLKQTKNIYNTKVKSYSIYNSPIMYAAPQFERIDIYNNDQTTVNIIDNFITNQGGFDIIHFNNLEGISIEVLKLKEKYPNTKFIYSMHNYFPICPNVFLWKHGNENCLDFNNGIDCCNCINSNYKKSMIKYKIKSIKPVEKFYKFVKNNLKKGKSNNSSQTSTNVNNIEKANEYKKFREKCTKYLNLYVDEILCVSKRVKEIAIKYGLDEKKCKVSYIGTNVANNLKEPVTYNPKDKMNLIYMGNMNKHKGFNFLVDAIENLDEKVSQKINLYLVCRTNPNYDLENILNNLKNKCNDVVHINGYSHDDFENILKNKNLGIIPVIWEDNLPQVAIELTCYGVPILTSDLGGASELCNNKNFCFKGNNINDFNEKLSKIINGEVNTNDFWKDYNKPKTMKEHLEELYNYYDLRKK